MIYELRNYRVASTPMMQHLHDRMENHVIPLFAEHDMSVAGAFEVLLGSEMPRYVYLLEWRDLAHRDEAFGAFYADDRWREIRRVTTERAGGEMLRSLDAELLLPATYSPMQ